MKTIDPSVYTGAPFWSASEIDRQVASLHTVRNNRVRGTMCDPDVRVGMDIDVTGGRAMPNEIAVGWSPDRAMLWGRLLGYLNPDGTKRARTQGEPVNLPQVLPLWWHVPTIQYASISDVAACFGVKLITARVWSSKGKLGPPDVLIAGGGRYPRPGWLPETVRQVGWREGFKPRAAWL